MTWLDKLSTCHIQKLPDQIPSPPAEPSGNGAADFLFVSQAFTATKIMRVGTASSSSLKDADRFGQILTSRIQRGRFQGGFIELKFQSSGFASLKCWGEKSGKFISWKTFLKNMR